MVNVKLNQPNDSLIESFRKSTKSIFQKTPPYERLLCNDFNSRVGGDRHQKKQKERLRSMRHETAKSKSGVWGPTHSFDSSDDNEDHDHDNELNKTLGGRSGEGTYTTKEESLTSGSRSHGYAGNGAGYGESTSHLYTTRKLKSPSPSTSSGSGHNHNRRHHHANKDARSSGYGSGQDKENTHSYAGSAVTGTPNSRRKGKKKNGSSSINRTISEKQVLGCHQCQAPISPLTPFQCSPRARDSNCDGNGDAQNNESIFVGIWNSASAVVNELFAGEVCNAACNQCQGNERFTNIINRKKNGNNDNHPNAENYEKSVGNSIVGGSKSMKSTNKKMKKDHNLAANSNANAVTLGIERLSPPSKEISFKHQRSNASSLTYGINEGNNTTIISTRKKIPLPKEISDDTARAAAKLMAETATNAAAAPKSKSSKGSKGRGSKHNTNPNSPEIKKSSKHQQPPFNLISVNTVIPFQNSISELTMRSSYGEAVSLVSDMRRMAYYAVGKNHSQRGNDGTASGGNRRCYFTGDPIIGGRPFYAGSVHQGLRTLIVFCLPSSVGLPKREDLEKVTEMELSSQVEGRKSTDELSRRTMTGLSTAALSQHDSIYNEDGFAMSEFFLHSSAWTEDENGNLCENLNPDFVIQALPDPNRELLLSMHELFPEQFASLSPHLRRPQCWRLYVKFCFFSGLPIADGEMYYKVMDEVVDTYGKKAKQIEEISLSHEVMEAVSGESAELLRLPGKKTFQYLQKHYKQQCAKLTPQKLCKKVFDRSSWIRVMPEV